MQPDPSTLSQWGPAWTVIAILLGLFLWAFKRLFDHMIKQQEMHQKFMGEAVNALRDLTKRIDENHESIREWFEDITARINLMHTPPPQAMSPEDAGSGRRGR